MTLEEKKNKIIEIIRKIPDESPIHKALYEFIKEVTRT
nr:MAG TPA: histone chaperone [Caudoviricetes sp.]